jgi:hypothetical protein
MLAKQNLLTYYLPSSRFFNNALALHEMPLTILSRLLNTCSFFPSDGMYLETGICCVIAGQHLNN